MATETSKIRASTRGWLTRSSRNLQTLVDAEVPNLVAILDAMEEFDRRLSACDEAQLQFEMTLTEQQITNEVDIAAEFRENARISRIKAAQIVSKTEQVGVNNNAIRDDIGSVHSSSSFTVPSAKLPKLELPSFSGDVREWTPFWEQFQVTVHDTDLPDVTKFTYLRSLLKGEAKSAVSGLSLTGENYITACDILNKRFGRKEKIIFSHIQELLSLKVNGKSDNMWQFFDKLTSHVRCLAVHGIDGREYGVVLTPLILSRFPQDLRMEWARDGEGHESDLSWLLSFLEKELQRQERSQTFVKESQSSDTSAKCQHLPTATALQTSTSDKMQLTCDICHRVGHDLLHCYNIKKGPVADRKAMLRKIPACFKCLSTDQRHSYRRCNARCAKCNGRHHELLCDGVIHENSIQNVKVSKQNAAMSNDCVNVNNNANPVSLTSSVNSVTGVSSRVLLQIAHLPIRCNGESGTTDAVVLFDTGSDRTYVTKSFIDKVKPTWVGSQCLAQAVFGSESVSGVDQRNLYQLTVQGHQETVPIVAAEVPVVCAPLLRPTVPQKVLDNFGKQVKFLDIPAGKEVKVDLLIGLDFYWKLVTGDMVHASNGLVAQRSICGWILSGSVPAQVLSSERNISHQFLCNSISESGLKNFWDLESLGIKDREDFNEHPVMSEFKEKVQYSEKGRYVVSLPWKSDIVRPKLVNNERLAQSRLNHLTARLHKNPELETKYHGVFSDMLDEGIIEVVPDDESNCSQPVFYMPHRPVIKESSLTTKIRPVFDASAKGFNGVSLNDCLETGPSLIPNLPGILLRFRRWKVALSADVTKAFLQIEIGEKDRDVHRFLWNDQGKVRRMRFVRVPFGNKSSPFLLNATLKHHLSGFAPSNVVSELLENLYVDDWLSGCDDDLEACAMLKEAVEVMNKAGMSLAKWCSNSDQVGELLCREFQDKSVGADSLKVLGMRWVASKDCFCFDGVSVSSDLCVTKRVVLSFISRLFDPLGFLAPFVMSAKCLFQELWRLGVEWDEVVSEEISERFQSWVKGLECLKTWMLPRSYIGVSWRDIVKFQLQGFGDASQSAYGACIYLHVQLSDGSWRSSLVIARAKVAPLKQLSLPRLELLGALLCARLVVYVKQELRLSDDVICHCWTDSMVALAWIRSDPHKWKAFVGNRVSEIQSLVGPSQWQHCPGSQNPADLVTRGISANELVKSRLWLEGPPFLLEVQNDSENEAGSDTGRVLYPDRVLISIAEEREVSVPCQVKESESSLVPVLDTRRWSSFSRVVRIMGWIRRFLHNSRVSRDQRKQGDLLRGEIEDARHRLFQYTQHQEFSEEFRALQKGQTVSKRSPLRKLDPFIAEDGLLRIQGRLQFSDLPYESAHPVILPKGLIGVLLAREVHDRMNHVGVNGMLVELRNKYWLIGARRICKQVKRECLPCQYLDAPAASQPMAPLPEICVKQSPPFGVTGIDHGGPLYCFDFVGKKFYILLFTCAVTRAVHLELVDSLSAEITVLALRRFMARRGLPSVIVSDNAKGFKAANEQMIRLYGADCPKWNFIPPRAPWWGGWWERLIGSVKSSLKRSIGKRCLSRTGLETLLHEVEACINSRPLTFVGDDLDAGTPLTPFHFLIGRSSRSSPVDVDSAAVGSDKLVESYETRTHQLDKFWFCWLNEYISNLPPYTGTPAKGRIKEGSVVLVQDQRSPRLKWPLGIVLKVHPGRDGLVRCVEVKTATGTLTRPIQKIHDLELTNRTDSDETILTLHIPDQNSLQNSQQTHGDPVTCDAGSNKQELPRILTTRSGRVVKPPDRLNCCR